MKRRDFLWSAGVMCAGLATSNTKGLHAQAARTDGWRTFELTTHVEVRNPSGATRVWLPAALVVDTPFQRTLRNTFTAPGRRTCRASART